MALLADWDMVSGRESANVNGARIKSRHESSCRDWRVHCSPIGERPPDSDIRGLQKGTNPARAGGVRRGLRELAPEKAFPSHSRVMLRALYPLAFAVLLALQAAAPLRSAPLDANLASVLKFETGQTGEMPNGLGGG